MKGIVFSVVVALAIAAAVALGGASRMDDHYGTVAVTVSNATADSGLSSAIVISTPTAGTHKNYDYLRFSAYIGDFTATDTGVGNKDSLRVTLCTRTNWYRDTIQVQTDIPPCTLNFYFDPRIAENGDTSDAGVYLGDDDYANALMNDLLEFNWYVYDSAGSGDTITATIQYWLRLVEDK